ncbi:hypothetical protein NOR_01062 [Metarhizium rileyi]|uniref:Uncharacterized protein n=1 Tax=Metarhizium rileyi (strain RCEF 4871) TaxID=1649241 RepID=A0A167JQR6_METRR|nr:hypothetical protein NOR_01062 [Metarhizium rileyi RCEF 4871]
MSSPDPEGDESDHTQVVDLITGIDEHDENTASRISMPLGDAVGASPEINLDDKEVDLEASSFFACDDGNPNVDSDDETNGNWEEGCRATCQLKWNMTHEKSQFRKVRLAVSRHLITELCVQMRQLKRQIRMQQSELAAAQRRIELGGPRPLRRTEILPPEIQFRILQISLCFYGQKVHVLSRLDPFNEPSLTTGVLGNDPENPKLLHRFHVGDSPVSLTFAMLPKELLAPLLGRFAKGIKGRVQRIQHIELLWMGSQHLTFEKSTRGRYVSRRTQPLMWLSETIRLATFDVHLPESSEDYTRRPYETRGVISYMKRRTRNQPDYRMYRSLRTLQGLDYVYCLRGVDRITFWDHTKWMKRQEKCKVRDTTFQSDVSRTVGMPKRQEDQEKSMLQNLSPLIPGLSVSPAIWLAMAKRLPELQSELTETDDDRDSEDDGEDDGDISGSDTGSSSSSDQADDDSDDDGSETDSESDADGRDPVSTIFAGDSGAVNDNELAVGGDTEECSLPNIIDLTLDEHEDLFDETRTADADASLDEVMTQESSQTIRDGESPEAKAISEDADVTLTQAPDPSDANQYAGIWEGSLFVGGSDDTIDLTGEAADTNSDRPSPEEAMRLIDAHVNPARSESLLGSNLSSASGLWCSPTRYDEIVRRSASGGARTEISGITSLMRGRDDADGTDSPPPESCGSRTSKRSYENSDDNTENEDGTRKKSRTDQSVGDKRGTSIEDSIEL